MANCYKTCTSSTGLIDMSGICDPASVTAVIKDYPYWKQMYITESLTIPEEKPSAEQINSIVTSVSLLSSKIIITPRSYNDTGTTPVAEPNLEGRLLTGRKLIVEGKLCQQIEYTADDETQPVHSVTYYVPFSSYIVVPLQVTINGTVVDSLNVDYSIDSCV